MLKKILGFVIILILSVFSFSKAYAGDSALLNVIGYSKDGRYFAFEEYGIQDGSGFAYSSIYIVDLNDDSWVVGTPIRVVEEYDEATYEQETYAKQNVAKTRALALEQAKFRLEGLEIIWPAWGLAFNGDGETDNDGISLSYFLPGYNGGVISEQLTISLEIYKAQSAMTCVEFFDKQAKGFLITKTNENGEAKEIYRDKTLSRSRGCPFTYKIDSIYVPFEAQDLSRSIAIISVYKGGFEGADRRFIAIPIGNKD